MAEIGGGGCSDFPVSLDTDSSKEVDYSTVARADVPNDLAACVIALETFVGTSGDSRFLMRGSTKGSNNMLGDLNISGDLVFYKNGGLIKTNPSDGSDNNFCSICGGGDKDDRRGSFILLRGIAFYGNILYHAADVPTGHHSFFTSCGQERFRVSYSGDSNFFENRVRNVGYPIASGDAANKQYVDDQGGGGGGNLNAFLELHPHEAMMFTSDYPQLLGNGMSNLTHLQIYFPYNSSTYVDFTKYFDKEYNGGNITVEVYWTSSNTTASQTVRWEIGFKAKSLDEDFTGTAPTLYGFTGTDSTTSNGLSMATTTIDPAELVAGKLHCIRLRRDHDHVDDILATDAKFVMAIIKYTRSAS